MIPRTLLARTFLLLAALVILTTTAWLSLFRYIEAEPRARETAQLAASAVNLIRAALFAAAPENRPGAVQRPVHPRRHSPPARRG
jgi:two-component system osmolarity sensor histidine kinase EnvZ